MGIVASDQTQQPERAATGSGRTITQEAAIQPEEHRAIISRNDLIADMQALRDSLSPQKTDALALLREVRAHGFAGLLKGAP